MRNVQKKLQEISQLKEKRDILNEEQKSKVSKEGDLQKEADELQSRLIALKKCFVCFTLKFLVWNNGNLGTQSFVPIKNTSTKQPMKCMYVLGLLPFISLVVAQRQA